jgi:hypothetical protein
LPVFVAPFISVQPSVFVTAGKRVQDKYNFSTSICMAKRTYSSPNANSPA